jgi:hypothetical protein
LFKLFYPVTVHPFAVAIDRVQVAAPVAPVISIVFVVTVGKSVKTWLSAAVSKLV